MLILIAIANTISDALMGCFFTIWICYLLSKHYEYNFQEFFKCTGGFYGTLAFIMLAINIVNNVLIYL